MGTEMTFGQFAESMTIMAIGIFLLTKALVWLKNAWAEAETEKRSKEIEAEQTLSVNTIADADRDDDVNPLLSTRLEHAHISLIYNDEKDLDR